MPPTVITAKFGVNKPFTYLRWTPHPVIGAIRDNKGYIRVHYRVGSPPKIYLQQSFLVPITGWGSDPSCEA